MDNTPNPGSEEAIAQGCKCPRIDNNNGAGIFSSKGDIYYWTVWNCTLHGSHASKILKGMGK